MQYNKKQFNKVNDKKIMKKVKKQWVVVSVATLAFLGASAFGMVNTTSAHAADTQNTPSETTKTNNNGNDASQSSPVQSTAASTTVGTEKAAGASQQSSSNQSTTDGLSYRVATTQSGQAQSSNGSKDNTQSNASSESASEAAANSQASSKASAESAAKASADAQSAAASAGVADYVNGNSTKTSVSAANQSDYSAANSKASDGFNNTLNGASAASASEANDANYKAASSYATTAKSIANVAVSDAVNGTNSAASYSSDKLNANYYSAAYAGAQAAESAYNNKINGQGTGTQDYTYYKNTAAQASTKGESKDGGVTTQSGSNQSQGSSSAASNGSSSANSAGSTSTSSSSASSNYASQVKPNLHNTTGGFYINGNSSTADTSSLYNASSAAAYTGNETASDNYNPKQGGADDPKSAHDSVISYENDLGNKLSSPTNTSVKLNSSKTINVANTNDVAKTTNLNGALAEIYNYSANAALAMQGMKDAETGKWTGVESTNNPVPSNNYPDMTIHQNSYKIVDYYAQSNKNLSTSNNPYDQAYLGAQAAIKAGFNSSNQSQTISALTGTHSDAYQNAYNDVKNKQSQNIIYVSNGWQLDNLMQNTNTNLNGLTVKLTSDINLHDVTGYGNQQELNVTPGIASNPINVTLDGQNHMADFAGRRYNFNSNNPVTQSDSITMSNFQTVYGQNFYGPVSFTGAGSITYNNVNYVGAQILSATTNDVYMNGNINIFQRDTTINSPFANNQTVEGGPGEQLNLDIKNLVLGKGAHYFGDASYYYGDTVVRLNNQGNLTLGEDSSMTLVPRGHGDGSDDANDIGININGSTLSVNKNANLNIIPDSGSVYHNNQNSTTDGAGGIYMASGNITVNGGSINIESNQFPYSAHEGALLNTGGNILVTNGGLIQLKAANLGNAYSDGLLYVTGGTVNVANRGNLIVAVPDGSGSATSGTTPINLIYGTLNVNDSGDSHVILDTGGNTNTRFVYNGYVNAYTAKVNGQVYYRYSLDSNRNVNSTDEYLKTQSNQNYGTGTRLDISSVPSVYFSGPLSAKRNSDNSITVSGLAKISGYDSTDYPDNNIYIQYAKNNSYSTNYRDSGYTPIYKDNNGDYSDTNATDSNSYQNTTKSQANPSVQVDTTKYSDKKQASDNGVIPISITIPDSGQSINGVGIYLKYGVNGVYMTAKPDSNGASDYATSIEGYNVGSNNSITPDSNSTVQTSSGSGSDIKAGHDAAINDAVSGGKSYDPTQYQRNMDYTAAYDGVMSGYKAITPELLQQFGYNNPSTAPNPITPELISQLQGTEAYKSSENPNAFMQGAQQAYADYLANQDASKDIVSGNKSFTGQDDAYTRNYNAAIKAAEQGMQDAASGIQQNRPADAAGQAAYDNAKTQYQQAQKAMDDAANNKDSVPNGVDKSVYDAGQTAYSQIIKDVRNGQTQPTDENNDPIKSMSPIEKALYKQEFSKLQQNYETGQNAALNGSQTPTDAKQLAGYNDAKDGFNGTPTSSDRDSEQNSAAYKAGQQAKTDEGKGADLATKGQSLPTNPEPSQAEKDGYDGAQAAYDAADGNKAKLSETDLAAKSMAFQAAYNAAIDKANQAVSNAENDYKNGVNNSSSKPTTADEKAYAKVQSDEQAGASAANNSKSDTPDAGQTDAYKQGFNIAKGEADAENGNQPSNTNKDSNYTTAYNNFKNAVQSGANAALNDKPDTNADQVTKDGFAYGQGVAALKNSKNPSASQTLSGKQQDGFNAAQNGYKAAMSGQSNEPQSPAAKAGFDYAKDLITGAGSTTEPNDSNPTQKAAYDDVQKALAQAKQDIADGKKDSNPDTSKASNADVYSKAYKAAINAYSKQLNPDANASAADIQGDDPIGNAAFNKVKSDALKTSGASAFTNGKGNQYKDEHDDSTHDYSDYNNGYKAAQQGYAAALRGQNTTPSDSDPNKDAYNAGVKAAQNDKQGFVDAENDTSNNSEAAQGAAAAIKAVQDAKGNLDNLKDITADSDSDSDHSSDYANAYNVALEDAKKAATDGISSQTNPANDGTNLNGPDQTTKKALANVYQAAATDAQKGYAEGLTGNGTSDSTNESEKAGNDKGNADRKAYEAAVNAYNQASSDAKNGTFTAPSDVDSTVYGQTIKALQDAASGKTTGDTNSPVYKVAYSQAKGANAAEEAIQAADNSLGKDTPKEISADDASIPADVKDKQSYVNAYNQAIAGYKAGLQGTDADKSASKDSADQQAFNAGKDAGDKAHGANDALNGMKSKEDVANDLNSDDPAKKAYAQGVTDANDGYADGLNGNNASGNNSNSPAYQKAKAQGQNDKAGYDAARGQSAPDANNIPDGIKNNTQAANAYQGYAAAVAAVKSANGNAQKAQRPDNFDSQSSDYKAAYQKALDDAIDANKAGQDAIANPSASDASQRPSDSAMAAVYDAAKQDAQQGYAEGLTGKSAKDSKDVNEGAGVNAGANDKAMYEAAVNDFANGITPDNASTKDATNASNDVYKEALKALEDAKDNKQPSSDDDKSPVYAVANSQAKGQNAAEQAIATANSNLNGSDPANMTLANVPAGVKDKQSYMNAYNDAIKGYEAGKKNDSSSTATNSDPADQQAFKSGKLAGDTARGADDALNGTKSNAEVSGDLDSSDADKKAYAQGVTNANNGYAQGLNDDTKQDVSSKDPAYQKAYAQGQDDKAGYDAAKNASNPDKSTVPSGLDSNATNAYNGYAAAVAAVKNANGKADKVSRPADFNKQSADYKAAYQKALNDAVDANKAGQDAIADPSNAAARPTDAAQAAVYDAAKQAAQKGYAEGLTGKVASNPSDKSNEGAGVNAGASDKASYEAAVKAYNDASDKSNIPAAPSNVNPNVYNETVKALKDAASGTTSDDNSPVYAVANSQALGSKDAEQAIASANNGTNGSTPSDMTINQVPDGIKDKQSYMNAYNEAVAGYNAGKSNDNDTKAANSDPADQQAFLNGKLAGQAARGADDALSGKATTDSVKDDLNSSDPATKAYAQGVKDANDGYADGLNGNNTTNNSPAYLRAQAQGKADASGYNEAKDQDTPDSNSVPSDVQGKGKQASDAYKGYADAINAVENAHGDLSKIGTPSDNQSNDYMAAYQKALQDAEKYAQNGQNAVAKSSDSNADKSDATDKALQKVYADAKHDTNNGFAEAVSGKKTDSKSADNVNEGAGIDAGNKVAAAYQAAANDFASGNDNPTQPKHYSDDATQQKAYEDALKGLADGQNNGSTTNDPKDASPVYAIANQQAQNVENALNAAKASQNVAQDKPNNSDLDGAKGYSNADNQSDMNDAYQAAAQAYQDAKNHANGNTVVGGLNNETSPAAKMAYAQAYKDAQNANQAAIDDFANGNHAKQPDSTNAAANAVYAQAQNDIQSGMNDGLGSTADQDKVKDNPAYAQGVDDAAAIKAAAQDAVNGTNDGKNNLTDNQKKAYANITDAAQAGEQEYSAHPDDYSGKTGDDLKKAAENAAAQKYSDPLKQAAFVQSIVSAGNAYATGAQAFDDNSNPENNTNEPQGLSKGGYEAAKAAYDDVKNGKSATKDSNGHYQPADSNIPASKAYDQAYKAALDKYQAAASQAANEVAGNNGTATSASDKYSKDAKGNTTSAAEQAAYNEAANDVAKGMQAAVQNDPNTNDSTYMNSDKTPKDDIASQAYAGAKAGYDAGMTGSNNEPDSSASAAYKAAYEQAKTNAANAAKDGVAEFANASAKSSKDGHDDAVSAAHNDGFNKAQAGYNAAIKDANSSVDHSNDTGAKDANYMEGVKLAQAAIKARQAVENNFGATNDSDDDTKDGNSDISGAAKAALAAAQNALNDGAKGNTNSQATPDANKAYGKIYQDTYNQVHAEVQQAAEDGAKAFATDNSAQHKVPSDTDKSATTKANDEGYKDAQDAYNQAANDPADTNTSTTGSAVGDATREAARAAFNDVANGTDNSNNYADNNSDPIAQIKHAAYQKALTEAKQHATAGAEALFNSNDTNSTANATTQAKQNAKNAADKAFNKGLADAKQALQDAQANNPSNDALYSGDKANTDAGQVYNATRDAYKAIANNQSASDLNQKLNNPVYKAAYDNALAYAKSVAAAGASDTADNSSNYSNNPAAQTIYKNAQKDYQAALQNSNPEGTTPSQYSNSVAYQAAQNAMKDYLNNNNANQDASKVSGISADNKGVYGDFYNKALDAIKDSAGRGVAAYEAGKNDVTADEGSNAGLAKVAQEAANRAKAGYEAVKSGKTSDDDKKISNDLSYQAGQTYATQANNGENEAMSDATQTAPDGKTKPAESDGFNGTIAGYNQAVQDGSKSQGNIDSYIANNLKDKSIAYRDAFKKAYQDGVNKVNAGATAALGNNSSDTADGKKGAADKAQSNTYNAVKNGLAAAAKNPQQLGGFDGTTAPSDTEKNQGAGTTDADEAAKGAAAAYNDVAGLNNAKPSDNANGDGNSVYKAAYQKALTEAQQNASDGAKALFDNNDANTPDKASSLAKSNATTAADRDYNAGLENAQQALKDAQASDATASDSKNDNNYPVSDNPQTDADNVYHATRDAYKAVENATTPMTGEALNAKGAVYAAAYNNALAYAKAAATAGSKDANGTQDNGSNYGDNQAAKAVYEHARKAAQNAYNDALKDNGSDADKYTGSDKGSVAYQAAKNAIKDYEANNGNVNKDPKKANISEDNDETYTAFYNKALDDIAKAANDGVNAYEKGTDINQVSSVEDVNKSLGQVAYQAALRAQKGHDDFIKNNGNTSDANKGLVDDHSYQAGKDYATQANTGESEAMKDATQTVPDGKTKPAESDGFNGTVDGYNKAAKDGNIQDIDSYIANNLKDKSVAYRDAFKKAYQDGMKSAQAGTQAALTGQNDKAASGKGAADKAQSTAYNDAKEAYQDALKGTNDTSADANSVSAKAGRDKATQFIQALKDVNAGHPNNGNTDANYKLGVKTAQTAMDNAIKDAKAGKTMPAKLDSIVVPDGLDPLAYRDVYAAILNGYTNGYKSGADSTNNKDIYYQLAFKKGYEKGAADIPAPAPTPEKPSYDGKVLTDFNGDHKQIKFANASEQQSYDEAYQSVNDGFKDGIKGKAKASASADANSKYYNDGYQLAVDGSAGMKLAKSAKKAGVRKVLASKDAAFNDGYRGYKLGLAAAKRNAKQHKALSKTDLTGKNRMYAYAYKQAVKVETKKQDKLGAKAANKRARVGQFMAKHLTATHSVAYVRSYIKAFKRTFRRHMPKYVYNVKTIFTHDKTRYSNKTRIEKYAYTKRYNSTVFRVVGVRYTKHGTPRYVLKSGHIVTLTANLNYVNNAYYKHDFKTFHVIKPTGVLVHVSKKFGRGNVVRRITRGQAFKIRKVVKYHGLTRLYIGHGEYVTSNKTYVKFGRK